MKTTKLPIDRLIHGQLRKELKLLFDEVLDDNDAYDTCVVCEYFSEKTELCALAKSRPPARVIAYGCEKFSYIGDDMTTDHLEIRSNKSNPASKMPERMSPSEIPRGGIVDDYDNMSF